MNSILDFSASLSGGSFGAGVGSFAGVGGNNNNFAIRDPVGDGGLLPDGQVFNCSYFSSLPS